MKNFLAAALAASLGLAVHAADTKPLRVLLITGGCCHEYSKQKDVLKEGLEKHANFEVTQVHTDDKSTKPPLAILGNPDYAKGFDLVIHDECSADIKDPEVIRGVLKPHADGLPGVNLHCAMHCYRIGNPGQRAEVGSERAMWFDYLGLQSSGHGPQEPIQLTFVDSASPITRGMTNWTTIREELYNNVYVHEGAHALARGTQITKEKKKDKDGNDITVNRTNETIVAWSNEYGPKKTRVFSTTIGHNTATVADERYLDLVTRGALWACGKLTADGKPAAGYEAKAK